MPPVILVDASNLHVGGGIQVAAAFINDLPRAMTQQAVRAQVVVSASSEVLPNLNAATLDAIEVVHLDSGPRKWHLPEGPTPHTIFTVFGPVYRRRRARREIAGFALPRLVYDLPAVGLPAPDLRERLTGIVRWWCFKQADTLVTETQDCAQHIQQHVRGADVRVVPNAVSDAVRDPAQWTTPEGLPEAGEGLLLAAVGRPYPHKNFRLLEPLATELELRLDQRVGYVTTLDEDEWNWLSPGLKERTHNMGHIRQRELAAVYQRCTATVFPSLLEVFSVTPLESMAMGVPVFASDLPSIRSAYGRGAVYFNPHDARRAAETIAPYLSDSALLRELGDAGRKQLVKMPTAAQRTDRYWGIICEGLSRA